MANTMKKILLLLFIVAPFFAMADGKVYNKSGELVYEYDGVYLTKLYKDGTKKTTLAYHDGNVYKDGVVDKKNVIMTFNGTQVFYPNNPQAIVSFDGKYIYWTPEPTDDPKKIAGCMVNKRYYRSLEPDEDKLVFRMEGDIPIVLLIFSNMSKQ